MRYKESPFPFLFSGKFGDFYGRVVNGKQIITLKRGPRKSQPSARELEIRKNFAIATRFLKPLSPVVKIYNVPKGNAGYHTAMSHILRNGIQGHHPNQQIDFSQVILGKGKLSNPVTYHVESPAKGLLEFNWSLEIMKRSQSKTDRIFTVTYCEKMHEFKYELDGAERRERQFLMDASRFSGQQVQVWFGFISPSGAIASTSIYAGPITVL